MTAALGYCPQCGDNSVHNEMAAVRLRLHAEIDEMSVAFKAVTLRTCSMLPVPGGVYPARKDSATTQELLTTWKELFDGICNSVLRCQWDLADDDGSPAKVQPQMSNSRRSIRGTNTPLKLLDPDPDAVLGIDGSCIVLAVQRKDEPKLQMELVEAAECRCGHMEDKLESLTDLCKVQWGISRQLRNEMAQIQTELLAEKREMEKFDFESLQLLSQMHEMREESVEMRQQLHEQAINLEQTLTDVLQLGMDLEIAQNAKKEETEKLSREIADITADFSLLEIQHQAAVTERDCLRALQESSPTKMETQQQRGMPKVVKEQFDAAINERDRLKKLLLLLQAQSPASKSHLQDDGHDQQVALRRQLGDKLQSVQAVRQEFEDEGDAKDLHLSPETLRSSKLAILTEESLKNQSRAEYRRADSTVSDFLHVQQDTKVVIAERDRLRTQQFCVDQSAVFVHALASKILIDSRMCYATLQGEYHSIETIFQQNESKLEELEHFKNLATVGIRALPPERGSHNGSPTAMSYAERTAMNVIDTAEREVQHAWKAVVQKENELKGHRHHTRELEALARDLQGQLDRVSRDRDTLIAEHAMSQEHVQIILDAATLEHEQAVSELTGGHALKMQSELARFEVAVQEAHEMSKMLQVLNTALEEECGKLRWNDDKANERSDGTACVHIYVHAYARTPVRVHTNTHARTRSHLHAHAHAHTRTPVRTHTNSFFCCILHFKGLRNHVF